MIITKKIISKILIFLFVFGLVVACIYLLKPIKYYLNNLDEFKEIIKGYGPISGLIIFLLQVLQVVIAIIPGDAVNLLGGYVLGSFWGFVISFVGMMCGSFVAFWLSRKYGRKLVEKLVKKETLDILYDKVNSKITAVGLFILCSIPFMPRDVLVYAAGLTSISSKKFFIIYGIARLPLVLIMSITGNTLFSSSKLTYVLIALLLSIFILYFGFKKKQEDNKN